MTEITESQTTTSGAAAAAEVLRSRAVPLVFGVPGGHNLPLFAAIEAAGLRSVGARHEQGAGFLAEAYGKLTGRPAVVVTTAGPGITNTLTPLAQAYAESVPICLLAVDNYLSTLSAPHGNFHAIGDLRSAVSPFAEWIGRASTPEEVAGLVDRALCRAAMTSRPTIVQLPSDMLTGFTSGAVTPIPPGPELIAPTDDEITALARLLDEAQQVVLYAGAGVVRSGAFRELERLATALRSPVVTTAQARGVLPDDHELALGPVWDRFGPRDEIARAADLVICLGTSLSPLATRNGGLPLLRTVHVDIDLGRPGRGYRPELAIRGDVKQTLQRLLDAHTPRPSGRSAAFQRWAAEQAMEWRARFAEGAPLASDLLGAIREAAPRETVFACDMTVLGYWAQRFLPVYHPGGLLSPYYFGTLGYGVPAGIGAKLTVPGAPVVAICGDAGFLMNSQELATATLHGVVLQVVVVNDGGYAAIHADERRTGLPRLAVGELVNPSFGDLAGAYGWDHQRVPASGKEVAASLADSMRGGRPTLTEIALSDALPMPYEISW